jgi:hypothetical protein
MVNNISEKKKIISDVYDAAHETSTKIFILSEAADQAVVKAAATISSLSDEELEISTLSAVLDSTIINDIKEKSKFAFISAVLSARLAKVAKETCVNINSINDVYEKTERVKKNMATLQQQIFHLENTKITSIVPISQMIHDIERMARGAALSWKDIRNIASSVKGGRYKRKQYTRRKSKQRTHRKERR